MAKKKIRRPPRRRSSVRPPQDPVPPVTIPAGQFKATCLAVMERVQRTGEPVIITKHGTPVVRVVPAVPTDAAPLYGRLRGTLRVRGDLLAPIDAEWDALADD